MPTKVLLLTETAGSTLSQSARLQLRSMMRSYALGTFTKACASSKLTFQGWCCFFVSWPCGGSRKISKHLRRRLSLSTPAAKYNSPTSPCQPSYCNPPLPPQTPSRASATPPSTLPLPPSFPTTLRQLLVPSALLIPSDGTPRPSLPLCTALVPSNPQPLNLSCDTLAPLPPSFPPTHHTPSPLNLHCPPCKIVKGTDPYVLHV